MITIEQLEKAWGAPVEKWTGNCYGLACAAAKLIEGAVPVYGHYLGKVAEGTFFEPASSGGFVQHGWVLMKNSDVVDPTRWAFEGRKPYIYNGPCDVYDEGGNALRMRMIGGPPEFDPESKPKIDILPHLTSEAWEFVRELMKLEPVEGYDLGHVTVPQLHWLATYDPRLMRGHATVIFAVLKHLNFKSLVPLDNWRMVERTPM